MASYTIAELEARSGIDRRTIAYYVQQGLLPRVGRRGARTRYPQPVLERLLFVVRVRRLQDEGRLRPSTLDSMARVLAQVDAVELHRLSGVADAASTADSPIEEETVSRLAVLFEAVEAAEPAATRSANADASTGDRGRDSARRVTPRERTETDAMLEAFATLVEVLDRRRPTQEPRRIQRCRVTSSLSISVEIGDRTHGIAVEECARSLALLLRTAGRDRGR